ncbi:MAG: J domain-containing protein [Verrucomicrobia bacterium]|nr:J domain-containing protein [Verrucomicrobiota bacterium]
MEFKDYYKTLGVPRTASDDELKKAFRKLAREFHPDVAKDKKRAEEKFKEINEAYEVLGDAAKRKKYDELGANWKQGAEFRPPPGWEQAGGRRARPGGNGGVEFEFGGTGGFSDFFEQLFGGRGRGRGGFGGGDFGRDFVHEREGISERGQDIEAELIVPLEEAARGAVRPISLRVTDEHGRVRTETYKVRIPAGVSEGQRLRLAGRGEAGAGGGEAGDLFLRVRYAKHPDFTVEDGHLRCDVEVAPWESVLGTSVTVPTLGGSVNIKVPAGTQSGQKLRVRGRGLPRAAGAAGDLLVEVKIVVPAQVSEAEKKLWEQLARESRFHPRE